MVGTFTSIEEMLDAETLGSLVDREIRRVERTSMQTEGFSENPMERITCSLYNGEELRFVLKHFDPDDWLTKLSADAGLREISLMEKGWYADLPEPCMAPAVAATRHGADGSLLMRDVSDALFAEGDDDITDAELESCVRAMSALHAHRWGRSPVTADLADLCSMSDWIGVLSPDTGRDRVRLGADNGVTAMLEEGWATFSEVASVLAAKTVAGVQSDPAVLLQALGSTARTVIHGDVKLANLGVDPTADRLVLLDWSFISYAPPTVELGWFLAVNSARLPTSKESVIDLYRDALAGHGVSLGSTWNRDLDLGLLSGGTLRLGWAKALGTLSDDEEVRKTESAEIEWWSEAAERAARWIE